MSHSRDSFPFLQALGFFVFGFSIIAHFYLGSAIDFHGDYISDSLKSLENTNIRELILRTLNPLTPGWFYPPSGLMEYMRPLQVLAFHLSHGMMPFSAVPFQLAAAISHGFLTAFMATIIHRWTKSLLMAWLAVILYASFPSNYHIMATIASFDLQYLVSVLDLALLTLFFAIVTGRFRKITLGLVLWFILLWITIKLKSSEKILPFVCGAYLILQAKAILSRIGRGAFIQMLAVLMLSMILVVPFLSFGHTWTSSNADTQKYEMTVKPTTVKDQKFFKVNPMNALYRIFNVPRKQQNAPFPLFSLDRQDHPISVTENFGFLFGWLFWLSLILAPIALKYQKAENKDDSSSFLILIALWLAAITAGYCSGAALEDPRYLNFAYIPMLLIFFIMASKFQNFLPKSWMGKVWRGFVAVIVLLTCNSNFDLLTAKVFQGIGIQDAIVRSEKAVHRDYYRREPDMLDFYRGHSAFEDKLMVINWYSLGNRWHDLAKNKMDREGLFYFWAHEEKPERWEEGIKIYPLDKFREDGYDVTRVSRNDFLDAKPPIFKYYKIKNKINRVLKKKIKSGQIYVFKVQAASAKTS